jgi:hypothetical protein
MPRDEIVEAMATAMWFADGLSDVGRLDPRNYGIRKVMDTHAEAALAALTEACPLVAGLLDDPKGIAGAVERIGVFAHDFYDLGHSPNEPDGKEQIGEDFDTVGAWLTGEGEGKSR